MIETSRLMGAGARTPLKMNPNVVINGDATVYPLFPGAIVALKGRNETGEWFQVSQILTVRNILLEFIQLRHCQIPRLPLNEDAQKQERPLTMTVAAGPYSLDSDLSYTPFLSLLDQIKKSSPSWLLLASLLTCTSAQPNGIWFSSAHSSMQITQRSATAM